MLSYMLPTGDKPPPGETHNQTYNRISRLQNHNDHVKRNGTVNSTITKMQPRRTTEVHKNSGTSSSMMITTTLPLKNGDDNNVDNRCKINDNNHSPKHNGVTITTTTTTTTPRKSTLHTSRVTKDDSLHSINSEASTVGSDRKSKIANGAKHANLKRVSFGSSKGSMVETLVYETPLQEEPEINHFLEHNGRLPMIPVPDTDEGREKVRVAFLGPQPHPATPGVLLLEPILPPGGHLIDIMSTGPAELLTTHTEHTSTAYHTQISTDSGWDNPFRPDGDLSREADEIVELIKGGKPITPTPGQNPPLLPGCDDKNNDEIDTNKNTTNNSTTGRINNGNGTQNKQPVNEKIGPATNAATVEVGRVMSQGPGDASQVEHVTLKKKPKCKCCVLQ